MCTASGSIGHHQHYLQQKDNCHGGGTMTSPVFQHSTRICAVMFISCLHLMCTVYLLKIHMEL